MTEKVLVVTKEGVEIFAKNDPFGEIVGREFVRRLVRDGHLKVVDKK